MDQTNVIEACDAELVALSGLQLDKHTTEDAKEPIDSIFSGCVNKRLWYSTFPAKLESDIQNDVIKYKVHHNHHYLAHVYMVQKLPHLRVKKEFEGIIQICWPHNCGNNITVSGELRVGELTLQTLDSKWLDDFNQFFVLPGYETFINDCQGNLPFLENWSSALPEYDLSPPQPYFFEYDTDDALPIFRINPQNPLAFKYKVRRNFRDILRMRKITDSTWSDITFNKNYIEGNFDSDELPQPELWGIYYRIDNPEIMTKQQKEYDEHEQIISDIISIDKDRKKYNSEIVFKLDSAHPCKGITVKAEKYVNKLTRNYSNYTSHENVYNGWSLIKSVPKLAYGPAIKITNLEHYHVSRMLPYWHATRVPYEKGFNLIPFSSKLDETDFDVGPILSRVGGGGGTKLVIELNSTDPTLSDVHIYKKSANDSDYIDVDEKIEESDDEIDKNEKDKLETKLSEKKRGDTYTVCVRLIISKTLVYKREGGDSKYYKLSVRKHQ